MSRPSFCAHCGTAVPADAMMPRLGAWWLCRACPAAALPVTPCGEYQHDYAGAVDDHGAVLWCCRRCGAVLQHQAISTEVVQAPQESGYIDC